MHFRLDKGDFKVLAHRLATLTAYPVAILNYRLTTPENKLRHPAHAEDVLDFLEFALDWEGPSGAGSRPYDASRIYVLGQSCGTHMITSILLRPPHAFQSSPDVARQPSPRVLRAVRGVVLSGGAYDLDGLIRAAPVAKELYVNVPFGDRPSYEPFNTAEYEFYEGGENIHWLVLRSEGDKVVDRRSNEVMVEHLEDLLKKTGSRGSVESHWELTTGHNETIHEEEYPRIVQGFVAKCEAAI